MLYSKPWHLVVLQDFYGGAFVAVAEGVGGHSHNLGEDAGEIERIVKAQELAYLIALHIGDIQEFARLLNLQPSEVVHGRVAYLLPEQCGVAIRRILDIGTNLPDGQGAVEIIAHEMDTASNDVVVLTVCLDTCCAETIQVHQGTHEVDEASGGIAKIINGIAQLQCAEHLFEEFQTITDARIVGDRNHPRHYVIRSHHVGFVAFEVHPIDSPRVVCRRAIRMHHVRRNDDDLVGGQGEAIPVERDIAFTPNAIQQDVLFDRGVALHIMELGLRVIADVRDMQLLAQLILLHILHHRARDNQSTRTYEAILNTSHTTFRL